MMKVVYLCVTIVWICCCGVNVGNAASITIDGSAVERRFDGIGGLSGGGATSRFLPSYQEPYISQIFDYLFTPNFGASLHICKVEIGGDCQTTEGTESSHMHSKNDLNFKRGYEWWIMTEAKKRNPDVLLYGLSWGVPGWIGNGQFFSQDNIDYHVNWVKGAKSVYNLDIDYIGVWNERAWDASWIINFRKALDNAGFRNTKIVAADDNWSISDSIIKNSTLKAAVAVVGAHYPGTTSTANSQAIGTPLWASEDYSTYADSTGGGCWGRILNQNYVNGYMTSTISWNLIASYYNSLPYPGDGLMWADNPWSGHYDVKSPIWVSAHTTQFSKPGWSYLAHGKGVGKLPEGGSYVTLVPPTKNGDFTLVIETFTHDHSICIRPGLPAYTVNPQTVTFQLSGGLASGKPLYVWKTHLQPSGNNSYFEMIQTITPQNGAFTLNLDLDSIVTVSTTTGQKKGQHPAPPDSKRFPSTYSDDFEKYPLDSEADYFMDQTGVWEVFSGTKSKVMRQVVLTKPIQWCGESSNPISLIGDYNTGDQSVTVDVLIETTGSAIIGTRVQQGGCGDSYGGGYFFEITQTGSWTISSGKTVLLRGTAPFSANAWYTLSLSSNSTAICAKVAGKQVGCATDTKFSSGFAAIGSTFNYVQFDNFKLEAKYFTCGVGDYIKLDICDSAATNQVWVVNNNDNTIRLKSDNTKCLGVSGKDPVSGSPAARLLPCTSTPMADITWKLNNNLVIAASGSCLDITSQARNQCARVETYQCNGGANQAWEFSSNGLLKTLSADSLCLAATS